MRSQLIFGALTYVRNRYELCQLASKAARKLHKPTTRLQDTMNDVLIRFHQSNPLGERLYRSSRFASRIVAQRKLRAAPPGLQPVRFLHNHS